MIAPRWILLACGITALTSGTLVGQTDAGAVPPSDPEQQVKNAEPDCSFFGPAFRAGEDLASGSAV